MTQHDQQQLGKTLWAIAACLSSLESLIAAQNAKLEALTTHKKGFMQQLFPSATEDEA